MDPRKKPPVSVQPPFLRPDLSDRLVTIKVSDNGIHGSTIIRSKVSSSFPTALPGMPVSPLKDAHLNPLPPPPPQSKISLDGLEGKEPQQPPLPPKADRYNQLKNQLTSSEG